MTTPLTRHEAYEIGLSEGVDMGTRNQMLKSRENLTKAVQILTGIALLVIGIATVGFNNINAEAMARIGVSALASIMPFLVVEINNINQLGK